MRGLRTKTQEFFVNVLNNNYSIIVLTETWLHNGIRDGELFGGNYSVYRKDRSVEETGRTRGGGLLVAVCDGLCSEEIVVNHKNRFSEVLCVKVGLGINDKLIIVVVYIVPNAPDEEYERLYEVVSDIEYIYESRFVILGDINLTELYRVYVNKESIHSLQRSVRMFFNFVEFLGGEQFNNTINDSGHVLDVVISKKECRVLRANSYLVKEDRHHPSLLIELEQTVKKNRGIGTCECS